MGCNEMRLHEKVEPPIPGRFAVAQRHQAREQDNGIGRDEQSGAFMNHVFNEPRILAPPRRWRSLFDLDQRLARCGAHTVVTLQWC